MTKEAFLQKCLMADILVNKLLSILFILPWYTAKEPFDYACLMSSNHQNPMNCYDSTAAFVFY
jgi:hypothetical protein